MNLVDDVLNSFTEMRASLVHQLGASRHRMDGARNRSVSADITGLQRRGFIERLRQNNSTLQSLPFQRLVVGGFAGRRDPPTGRQQQHRRTSPPACHQ